MLLRSPPLKVAQRVAEQLSKGEIRVWWRSPPLKAAQRVAERRPKGRYVDKTVHVAEGSSAEC